MNRPGQPISVVLVDDHALIREGLRRSLERSGEFAVVGEAENLRRGRELALSLSPDVMVIDVRLPDGLGTELVRQLARQEPRMGLVVLTMYAGDEQVLAAKQAGASAFVSKDGPVSEVMVAIRRSFAEPRGFSAPGLEGVLQRIARPSSGRLTAREREVLLLLAEGLGVAGISRRLYISESTTKTHISNIYSKLGASNRAQAIMAAHRDGLLPPSM